MSVSKIVKNYFIINIVYYRLDYKKKGEIDLADLKEFFIDQNYEASLAILKKIKEILDVNQDGIITLGE